MTRFGSLLRVAASREVSQRSLRIVLWCALPFLFWLYFESPFTRPVPLEDLPPAYGSTILQIGQALWADGLGLVSHAALSYLGAALIIAIDLMFGLALLRWMSRKTSCHLSPALRAASALALGCGFAGMAVFGLGAGHHLTRNAVVGITALMAVTGIGGLFKQQAWRWGFSFLAAFRPSRANRKLIMASTFLLLPAIAIHGFDLLLPVLEFDSTMYQMSAAKLYREQQAVAYHPGIRFNGQPQLPVLIYLRYWFLLESDSLLKLANLEFSFILLLTLVAAARQLRWRDSWFLGVLYLASMPIVCFIAKVEYADLALTAFSGLGIFLVLYQLRHPRLRLHVPTGLVFGFAVSCKHLGLMLFAAALVGYVAAAWVAGIPLRRLARTSFLLVVLAGLVGSGWWLRSWLHTGTPLHPFLTPTGESAATTEPFTLTSAYQHERSFSYVVGAAYLLVAMQSDLKGHPDGFGISLLLMLIAGAFAVVQRGERRRVSGVEWVFLIVAFTSYFLVWSFTSIPHRHLAPLAPMLAMLFLMSTCQSLGANGRLPRILTIFLVAIALHTSFSTSKTGVHRIPPPKNQEEKQLWLQRALPYYGAVQAINETARSSDWTYLLLAPRTRFYVDTVSFGDWFGHYSYGWLFQGVDSDQALVAKLKDAGFQYLLVDYRNVRQSSDHYPQVLRDSAFRTPEAELTGAGRIFSDRGYSVFRLD